MSRIGKNPIKIPEGVSIEIDDQVISAKGKLGQLSIALTNDVNIEKENGLITISQREGSARAKQMWGTARSLVSNLVVGVSEGFTKRLEINGVGYRAQLQGKELVLQLGFSHDIKFSIPDGITITCSDQTHIEITGINKQMVGQVASNIRSFRPPEPYKGKGIKYEDEYILRKEGKKK
ncbi:MAG: 50S ribosomal protein L6 [Magnetovibrio sp.]|nr:50S ribosomal protein L6 [Magnetovibrio sp.]